MTLKSHSVRKISMLALATVLTGSYAQAMLVSPRLLDSALNKAADAKSATAKPSQNKKYSLKRAIDEAISSSAILDIARRQVMLDSIKISEAGSPLQPSVSLSASETRFDRPTVIAFGTTSVVALHDHLEVLQAQLTQTLDFLGHVRDARNAARLQQAADVASFEAARINKALEAKIKYINYLRAKHQVDVASAALAQAKTQESTAKKLYDSQVGQKVDYLRAQSNTAQAEQNLTAAKSDFDIAIATFNNLIGKPVDTPVDLEDIPGVNVGADIEKLGPVGSDPNNGTDTFKLFTAPVADISAADVNGAIGQAQVRRPEILQATALVRAGEVGIRIAHESIEPSFALSLTGDRYPTTSLSYPRKGVASLGISANFPIFDGGVARDEVQQASVKLAQGKTQLEKTKTDIALEVKSDYLMLLTAAKQLESANANLKTAIAARQLAQIRYSSQVGIFLEVSDAQAALVRAESQQVDAVYTYFSSLAAYEAALGLPINVQTNALSGLSENFAPAKTAKQ